MFPDNVIVACFKRSRTEQLRVTNTKNITTGTIGTSTGFSTIPTVSWTETNIAANTTEEMSNSSDHFQVPESGSIYALPTTAVADVLQDQPDRFEHFVTQVDGINVLGLVMYSLLMSLAIRCMGEQGQILTDILTAFYQCTLKLIYFISWYSPIGIFFLFTAAIIELQEPSIAFRQLALYTGTALVANLGYCLMLLPLVYYLMTHKNPRKFFYKNSLTLLTSFATTCNLTTLPVMLQCAERRVKLHHQVTRIILPLGAILNTSAGALYKCVACIFMAQYEGVSLTIGKLIIISITSAFVSIGTRNLPQNGNIGLLAVLTAANIPTENISLILAADWILNRISVTVNTMVDIVGAGVIHHLTSINKIN
ncbi:excitatory amino acid transporter 3-like [Argonauta hians]